LDDDDSDKTLESHTKNNDTAEQTHKKEKSAQTFLYREEEGEREGERLREKLRERQREGD